jgi:hypothetical protein
MRSLCLSLMLATLAACSTGDSGGSSSDVTDDTTIVDASASVDGSAVSDVAVAADAAGDLDATASQETSGPAEDTNTPPPVPAAEPFDFAATQPWYQCPSGPLAENTVEVVAFDKVIQQFGDENTRNVDSEVTFPEGSWAQVGMWVELECPPSGLCDHWDRSGSIQMLLDPAEDAGLNKYVELARHITPYKIGMCEYIDITNLAPVLTGTRTLRSFIDTWVGPGHSNGEGWQVTVKFVFYPGEETQPSEVINIWGRRSITVGIPEGEQSVTEQTAPVEFELAEGFTKVVAHLTTTGHSFGNTYNCAEFCEMRQDLHINESVFSVNPWRPDCAQNPVSPQYGTWEYPRNGWCPGAISVGSTLDITSGVTSGTNTLDFDILLANGTVYNNLSPVDLLPHELVALKLYVFH